MSQRLGYFALLSISGALTCNWSDTSDEKPAGRAAPGRAAESAEPPVEYTLVVGDETFDIREDVPIRLDGTLENPQVTLQARPHRRFSLHGLTFSYLRAFTFEADLDEPATRSWTLSGNDCKIMFFLLGNHATTTDYANQLVSGFGRENCRVADAEPLELRDTSLTGTRVDATIAGNTLAMEIYEMPTDDGSSRLLVLQDNLDDAGNHSEEGRSTRKLLREELVVEP